MASLLDLLLGGQGGVLGGQAPQQQQLPEPTDPNRLGVAVANFGGGGNLVDRLIHAGLGTATGQRTDPIGMYQQMAQQTYTALMNAGVPEPQARLGATNPDVQKAITAKMFPTYAPQNIGNTTGSFNPATGQFTPQYVAPEFKTVAPGDTGISYQPPVAGAAPGPLGRSAPIQSAPLAPAAATALQNIANLPPVTGQPAAPTGGTQTVVPGMSLGEKEAQIKAGQAAGAVRASLPAVQQKTEQALQIVDALQNHPGRQGITAPVGMLGKLPAIPGSQGYDFVTMLEQAKSGLFRTAIQDMRGLGSLSDKEGLKVETAIGRLDRAQTKPAFDQALSEVRNTLQQGWQNAQAIAAGKMEPYKSSTPIAPPGFKQAPDGKFYSEKPGSGGKYQVWTPG